MAGIVPGQGGAELGAPGRVECRQHGSEVCPVVGLQAARLVEQGDLGRQDRETARRSGERLVQRADDGLVAPEVEDPVLDLVEQHFEEVGLE